MLSQAPDRRSFIPGTPSSDARPAEPMAVLNRVSSQRPQVELPVSCDAFPLLYASSHRHRRYIECIFTLSFCVRMALISLQAQCRGRFHWKTCFILFVFGGNGAH